MHSHIHIYGRQRVMAAAGVKCAFEFVDVRDVERTPVWMHAHNALIDKLLGETPENPLYHPGFATLDERTLLSMVPEKEQKTLQKFYPQVAEFMVPADPPPAPLQLPPEPKMGAAQPRGGYGILSPPRRRKRQVPDFARILQENMQAQQDNQLSQNITTLAAGMEQGAGVMQDPSEPKVANIQAQLGALTGAATGASLGSLASENPSLWAQLTGQSREDKLKNMGIGAGIGTLAGAAAGGLGGRRGMAFVDFLADIGGYY